MLCKTSLNICGDARIKRLILTFDDINKIHPTFIKTLAIMDSLSDTNHTSMEFMNPLSIMTGIHPVVLALVLLWSLIWKGIALWRASHLEQKYWFGIILVVNTLGLLEIVYLLINKNKNR